MYINTEEERKPIISFNGIDFTWLYYIYGDFGKYNFALMITLIILTFLPINCTIISFSVRVRNDQAVYGWVEFVILHACSWIVHKYVIPLFHYTFYFKLINYYYWLVK